jgi:hypothetical protein
VARSMCCRSVKHPQQQLRLRIKHEEATDLGVVIPGIVIALRRDHSAVPPFCRVPSMFDSLEVKVLFTA